MGRSEPILGNNSYGICCGRFMHCSTTRGFVEGGVRFRQRFWECETCAKTTQSVDEVPRALVVWKRAARGGGRRGVGLKRVGRGHDRFRRH